MGELAKNLEKTVLEALPKEVSVSKVELEGPEIAVYTRNPKAFFENENLVAKLAFDLKKRVNIRTDKSLLKDPAEAKKIIAKIIPEDAGVKEVMFNSAFSEVMIEALKPGLVIGKGGMTSKSIILETGWTPNILRAPTADSKILTGVRNILYKYSAERKKFLTELSEKIYREAGPQKDWIRLIALGGYRQVGRSCSVVETPITKVMLDCGINVADSEEAYPYLEILRYALSEIDAVIVSHAHLDHSGFVPYLFKMGYTGPVYCTPPTRDLMSLLQFDLIDVAVKEGKEPVYGERDVKEMIKHTITREYGEVTDIAPDMRLTFHNAAHILGSSSVHLHIGAGAHNLIYSGDLKFGFTRSFNNLETIFPRLETLIIESTYGGKEDVMPNKQDAEIQLLNIIKQTFENKGNVLIPVFAVGRAQEVMLVLEEFYKKNLLDAKVYIDGMTKEASAIHTAYPEFLRRGVQRRVLQNDSPFTSQLFHEISAKDRDLAISPDGGSIIIASSGMLTGGPSVEYLYKMAENPNNTLVFVGWQSYGSMGRKIQGGLRTLTSTDEKGKTKTINLNMRVETLEAFSGHSDVNQLLNYIRSLKPKPKRIIVDHGEQEKTVAFARFIANTFRINTTAPRNLEAVRLR